MVTRFYIQFLSALIVLGSLNSGLSAVTASWGKNPVTVGEATSLFVDSIDQPLRFAPVIQSRAGISVASNRNQAPLAIQAGVGKVFRYNYSVTPSRPGTYEMGFNVTLPNGSNQPLSILPLKVLPQQAAQQPAFFRVTVPRSEVYVGELVPLNINLLSRHVGDTSYPQIKMEGFLVHSTPRAMMGRIMENNVAYHRITFQKVVKAIRTGDLTLGPISAKMDLRVPGSGGRLMGRTVNVLHDGLPLKVKELPIEGRPASFSGVVGNINSFTVTPSSSKLFSGDALTLSIRLRGEGNISDAKLIFGEQWRDFDTFDPQESTKTFGSLGIQAEKIMEQVVVPSNSEITNLPPIEISWFDPKTSTYKSIETQSVPIEVMPAEAALLGAVPTIAIYSSDADEAPDTTLAPIRRSEVLGERSFLESRLVPMIALMALAFCGMASGYRWFQERLENDPALRRRHLLLKRKRSLEKQFAQMNSSTSYDDLNSVSLALVQVRLALLLGRNEVSLAAADDELRALEQRSSSETAEVFQKAFELIHGCDFSDRGKPAKEEIIRGVRATENASLKQSRLQTATAAILLASLALWPGSLRADLQQANQMFDEGRFDSALEQYQSLLKSDQPDATILFNIGTTYLHLEDYGRGTAHLKAARWLNPRSADISRNLRIAASRSLQNEQHQTTAFTQRVLGILSQREWTAMFLVTLSLACVLMGIGRLRRWNGFISFKLPLALCGISFLLTLFGHSLHGSIQNDALIVTDEAIVRFGPTDEAKTLFVLSDGQNTEILGDHGDWSFIQDGTGRRGWTRKPNLLVIRDLIKRD